MSLSNRLPRVGRATFRGSAVAWVLTSASTTAKDPGSSVRPRAQLQTQSDDGRAERLARIQGAAGNLANELSVAVSVEPASLKAALVHAMRLVGVGTNFNGICAQLPMLEVERSNGDLLLVISARGSAPADTPRERADLRLMAQAAERVASDHCGSLTLCPDKVTFRLPLSHDN